MRVVITIPPSLMLTTIFLDQMCRMFFFQHLLLSALRSSNYAKYFGIHCRPLPPCSDFTVHKNCSHHKSLTFYRCLQLLKHWSLLFWYIFRSLEVELYIFIEHLQSRCVTYACILSENSHLLHQQPESIPSTNATRRYFFHMSALKRSPTKLSWFVSLYSAEETWFVSNNFQMIHLVPFFNTFQVKFCSESWRLVSNS